MISATVARSLKHGITTLRQRVWEAVMANESNDRANRHLG
jgi:hypothetical protein